MPIDPLINAAVFGGYIITRKLGEGGMGAVYLAEDEKLGKNIAVKVLLPALSAHEEIVERFKNEAVAASALNHPHIIDIVARGELDGRHWIAMQFLEGSDLGGYLAQWGRLAPEAALEILVQTCSALHVAHEKQIVHRDLKPDNIFITRAPVGWQWPSYETPFVKLLDFGIAKLGDPRLAGQIKTRTHQVMGTPSYMAPEQARGLLSVDHRADIYALGVIAYQMITGQVPFSGNSLADIVVKQATTLPRQPIEFMPSLPIEWNDTILSAVAVDPDQRPQSVHAFCKMLCSSPELENVARSLDATFIDKAAPDDDTAKATPAMSASMLSRAGQPTTLSAAAGVAQQSSVAQTKPGPMRWVLTALLVVGLGVGGVLLATSQSSDNKKGDTKAGHQTLTEKKQSPPLNPHVPAGTTAPPRAKTPSKTKLNVDVPAGADAIPKLSMVTITSSPAGAMLQIDDKPASKAPLKTRLTQGTKITVRAELRGHAPKTKTFVVSTAAAQEFELLLVRQRRSASTKRRPTKRRPRPKAKGEKTAPKPKTKPKPEPLPFDPNAPAGT